ncbi:MAG: TVP38/TMEM64 family protein [Oceanicaulis sp.]
MDDETEHAPAPPPEPSGGGAPLWKRLLPLAVLAAGLALFFALGGQQYLNANAAMAMLRDFTSFVEANLWLAALAYLIFYALAVAISVPGAIWFTLGAGFLFGPWLGAGIAVLGATIGATILFLAARYAFAGWVREKFPGYVKRLQDGFSQDAFTYVMILRLIPVFPFFVINLATALLNVPLRAFVLASLIGMAPGAYVYAAVGGKLSNVVEEGVPSFTELLDLELILALVVFAALAVFPAIYKRVTGKKAPVKPAEGDA